MYWAYRQSVHTSRYIKGNDRDPVFYKCLFILNAMTLPSSLPGGLTRGRLRVRKDWYVLLVAQVLKFDMEGRRGHSQL